MRCALIQEFSEPSREARRHWDASACPMTSAACAEAAAAAGNKSDLRMLGHDASIVDLRSWSLCSILGKNAAIIPSRGR